MVNFYLTPQDDLVEQSSSYQSCMGIAVTLVAKFLRKVFFTCYLVIHNVMAVTTFTQ